MDSTIVDSETLDELAAEAGVKDRVAPITARAMNGEIDFKAALRERVAPLADLPEAALERAFATVRLNPRAPTLDATTRAHGAYTVPVSGGFPVFPLPLPPMHGVDAQASHRFPNATGRNHRPASQPLPHNTGHR